jgi:hypothetical protein
MNALYPLSIAAALALGFTSVSVARQTSAHKMDHSLPPPKGLKTKLPLTYDIKTLDISGDRGRQVLVDRETGQDLGPPTTLLLEDGMTILAVYPKGRTGGPIVYKRSTNAGRTWSERLPTPKSWETSTDVPTLHRMVSADGTKRVVLFTGHYPIRMAVSEDAGTTWSELKPIGNFGGRIAMASVASLGTGAGHYLGFFHDSGDYIRGGPDPLRGSPAPKSWRHFVYSTLSHDGGLTWSIPVPIAMRPDAALCEPGVLRSPDGKQIAVLMRENSRQYNSFVIFSDDEGLTWTQPRELPAALTGDRHVAKYAPDSRLFISFRDMTHVSPTWGDWIGWVGTYEDIVKGREGQYRVRLMDNTLDADSGYSGVETLPDGTFVATSYGHWTEGKPAYIVSVHLKLDELEPWVSPKTGARP